MDKRYFSPEIWGGIESTINRVGDRFNDQLEHSGHYSREEDIDQIARLGISKLRYPILWEKHQPEKGVEPDFTWIRPRLEKLKGYGIDVIAGLVHHGSGPAFTNLLDPHFPGLLADYAVKVAKAFPWIEYYTPVNEPLTTARFSGLYGLWYPHATSAPSFLRMLINQLKGVVLSMKAIRRINPSAKLVQTEDLGKTYSVPRLKYQADFENERRWLTFDLLCGKVNRKHRIWPFMKKAGINTADIDFFRKNKCEPDIFGFNHYLTSERFLDTKRSRYPSHTHGGNGKEKYADVEAVRVSIDEPTGIGVLLKEAWERYRKPMAVTEVHLHCHREEQLRWFRFVHNSVCELIGQGAQIKAITTWALLGSYGWNKLLTQPGGDYEPGAFDLSSGQPRPTALARYLQQITDSESHLHPLVREKGWWERSTRLIYEPSLNHLPFNPLASPPILILGKNGRLGKAFIEVCENRCLSYVALDKCNCDIARQSSVEAAIDLYKPWAVINAAGYSNMEAIDHEEEVCFRENASGALALGKVCRQKGIKLVSFSSDQVFDGTKNEPYLESDLTNPLNIFGRSKQAAEKHLLNEAPGSLIIRTGLLLGPDEGLLLTSRIRSTLSLGWELQVAHDAYFNPCYIPDLANASLDLLIDGESEIWNLSHPGKISWSDLAKQIASGMGFEPSGIVEVPADEMAWPVKFPRYSVLGSERGLLLPSLDQALSRYITGLKRERKKVA
jgi:dTDP-4-dehydrorhamnose reductase